MQLKKAELRNAAKVFGANVDAASLPRCLATKPITKRGRDAASTLANITLPFLNRNKLQYYIV
jgi:hypothetical protein